MRHWPCVTVIGAALLALRPDIGTAQKAPGSDRVWRARIALRFDPIARCPDVRPAADEDEVVAVVLFQVGSTGVPSRASIKSPSGSEALDAAAVDCVLKLRFQPATRIGDGVAIDSWQEMAWKQTRRAAGQNPLVAAEGLEGPHPAQRTPEVQACVDEAGRLAQDPTIIHSSGDPRLDEAAVQIARSGAGYYRPATMSEGKSLSGCVQLTIKFEHK